MYSATRRIERMNEDDTFLINVQIGGLRMPLRIPRKDEELYRRAEKLLVKQMDFYQKKYYQYSTENIYILVAYQLAVMVSKQEYMEDIVPMAEKIQSLDDEIKSLLSK